VVGGDVGYVASVEGGAVDNEGFSVLEGAPLYLRILGLNLSKVRGVSARQYCFTHSILEALMVINKLPPSFSRFYRLAG
jgi:hypothetical protein